MPLSAPDTYSLWRAIEPVVDFPSADEERTGEVGRAWADIGAVILAASQDVKDLPEGIWTDEAGRMYAERITALKTSAKQIGDRMARLGWLASAYGEDVLGAKRSIIQYIAELEEEYREQPQVVAPLVATEVSNLLANIEGRIRARATSTGEPALWVLRGLDELTAPLEPTVLFPRPYGPGNPGPSGSLEGMRVDVMEPGTGRLITDVDKVEGGVLWEDKTAVGAQDPKEWAQSQVYDKLAKYVYGQQVSKELEEYRNAPIGIRLHRPGVEPELRAAIEEAVARFQREHPDVDVRVEYLG